MGKGVKSEKMIAKLREVEVRLARGPGGSSRSGRWRDRTTTAGARNLAALSV